MVQLQAECAGEKEREREMLCGEIVSNIPCTNCSNDSYNISSFLLFFNNL